MAAWIGAAAAVAGIASQFASQANQARQQKAQASVADLKARQQAAAGAGEYEPSAAKLEPIPVGKTYNDMMEQAGNPSAQGSGTGGFSQAGQPPPAVSSQTGVAPQQAAAQPAAGGGSGLSYGEYAQLAQSAGNLISSTQAPAPVAAPRALPQQQPYQPTTRYAQMVEQRRRTGGGGFGGGGAY